MRAPLLVALIGGCAADPVADHSGNEIPKGPGLLAGTTGEFVLSADEWRRYQEWKQKQQ